MLLLAGLMLPVAGCRRAGILDEKERNNRILAKASEMVDLGDYDAAVSLYRNALDTYPAMARPHLDLALLLHDRQKDYIRAIYHYKRYLELRPGTEKDDMIHARMKQAERAFVASRVTVNGADGASAMQLLEENGTLRARLESMETIIAEQEKELLALREAERRRLRDEVITGGTTVTGADPVAEPEAPRNEVVSIERPPLQPVVAPTIEPVRPPAPAEPVSPPVPVATVVRPVAPAPEPVPVVTVVRPVAPAPEPVPVATVVRPVAPAPPVETALIPSLPITSSAKASSNAFDQAAIQRSYTVQRGDSLSRIAFKVYGDATRWRGIQEANRAALGDDSVNVRVGQLLIIP